MEKRMRFSDDDILTMIAQLDSVCEAANKLEEQYEQQLSTVNPKFKKSALNLIHYMALRHQNILDLQLNLDRLGVSMLDRAEGHVMTSLLTVRNILSRIVDHEPPEIQKTFVSVDEGMKFIRANTSALLGKKLKGSRVRIMVTLPTEAADDKKLVYDILASGMNCARINCAHDDEEIWRKMINKVKWASRKTGRNCPICMDLGGPKLRTGSIKAGPRVIHIQPRRDLFGRVSAPASVWLAPPEILPPEKVDAHLPLLLDSLRDVGKGDRIVFKDTRSKNCTFRVTGKRGKGILAVCNLSAYVKTGTELQIKGKQGRGEKRLQVGELPEIEQKILLRMGDTLKLHRDTLPGEPAEYGGENTVVKPAHVSCTLPEVFVDIRQGERILFDDGKIEGVVRSVSKDEIEVEITYAKEEGTKLGADKGINLPESNLRMSGLTNMDRENLRFIGKHADVVNMSFVNEPQDVYDLLNEIERLHADQLGIILKIETQRGCKNLPAILLAVMRAHPVSIMIARGDLAIESGWQYMAEIQEEILWVCEAAHIPIVWATQVLETLSKKGRPSRAEITDAAMAQRTECVMLNKGPHIVYSIQMLDKILKSMEDYYRKKGFLLPELKTADYLQMK
jgi:pyruvate kinase